MEIRVLGPIEVESSTGTRIKIGSAKQRELLALLAAHAPEVVSTDRIVDTLWPGDEDDHVSVLRFHVSKLRGAVGKDRSEQVIVTRPGGYGLGVPPDYVDAHRFAALVTKAEKLDVGDAAAGELVTEALALWGGTPYGEFEYTDWAREQIRHLNELRLVAQELQIETGLAAGGGAGLVPELEALVAEHPLRERFWAQLMTAFYRSGRQGDALRAFQDARRVLGEELGIEPGVELRDLEEMILLQDPALSAGVVRGPQHNLPESVDPFVGREDDVRSLERLIPESRLTTLIGPGGIGKTRLATEVARSMASRFGDGAWLVDLTALADPALVPQAISEVLRVGEVAGTSATDALIDALGSRQLLLVLDNCEHVIDVVASTVGRLLESAPGLRVVATSREPLRMAGEHRWQVDTLGLPDEGASPELVAAAESVRLFVDRATQVRSDFTLDNMTLDEVGSLCRRLDGLPLAIELGAARISMFSVEQIAAGVEKRLAFLRSGSRTAAPHHRTMEAALDWSYNLLDGPAQQLLRRLSVVEGGCTYEAVTTLWDDQPSVGEVLERLVDSSLVIVDFGAARYRILETTRDYARRRLTESGEAEDALRRHALYHWRIAERANEAVAAERSVWNRELKAEVGNFNAALAWSLQAGDDAIALGLGSALARWWAVLWGISQGEHWMRRLLQETDATPTVERAEILRYACLLASRQADQEATGSCAQELHQLAVRLGEERYVAIAMDHLAWAAMDRGDLDEAEALAIEAIRRLGELDDPFLLTALHNRATTLSYYGRLDEADTAARELIAAARQQGDPGAEALARVSLGWNCWYRGDMPEANQHFEHARQGFQELEDPFWLSEALVGLGWAAYQDWRLDDAAEYGAASLRLLDRRDESERAGRLDLLALVEQARGNSSRAASLMRKGLSQYRGAPDELADYVESAVDVLADLDPMAAATVYGAVVSERERLGLPIDVPTAQSRDEITRSLKAQLGNAQFEEAAARGAEIPPDTLVPRVLQMLDQCTPLEPQLAVDTDRLVVDDHQGLEDLVESLDAETAQSVASAARAGTITLMFTDIEDSTSIAESVGDAEWVHLMEDHFTTIRRIVQPHGGKVVKTLGDGAMIAFPSVREALSAAVEMQRTWAPARYRVRIGVHTGDAVQASGDYAGIAVNKAARITSAASGGEILVSSVTADLAAGYSFEFGAQRSSELKGLTGTHRLFPIEWQSRPPTST